MCVCVLVLLLFLLLLLSSFTLSLSLSFVYTMLFLFFVAPWLTLEMKGKIAFESQRILLSIFLFFFLPQSHAKLWWNTNDKNLRLYPSKSSFVSGIYVWTILTEIFTVMTLLTVLVCFCPKTLMSEPEEIATMTGQKIPRKCSIGKLYRVEITYQTGVRVFQ